MVRVETLHLKGISEINEDSYVCNEESSIYAVIDGATGLGGLSGAIASKMIAQSLIEENGGLLERIKRGNEALGKQAVVSYGDSRINSIDGIPKHLRSTCGIAAIELVSGMDQNLTTMKHVAAADCIIFLQYINGQIRQINYDYMEDFDRPAIQMEQDHWNDYLAINENPNTWSNLKINQIKKTIHENIQHVLKQNRKKLNTSVGYGIIDGSEEALMYLETGVIPLVNVQKILLLTDGLKIHSPLDKALKNEWIDSAKLACTFGLNYLGESILEIEKNDPACYHYPRFKQHDDKTGILITLE